MAAARIDVQPARVKPQSMSSGSGARRGSSYDSRSGNGSPHHHRPCVSVAAAGDSACELLALSPVIVAADIDEADDDADNRIGERGESPTVRGTSNWSTSAARAVCAIAGDEDADVHNGSDEDSPAQPDGSELPSDMQMWENQLGSTVAAAHDMTPVCEGSEEEDDEDGDEEAPCLRVGLLPRADSWTDVRSCGGSTIDTLSDAVSVCSMSSEKSVRWIDQVSEQPLGQVYPVPAIGCGNPVLQTPLTSQPLDEAEVDARVRQSHIHENEYVRVWVWHAGNAAELQLRPNACLSSVRAALLRPQTLHALNLPDDVFGSDVHMLQYLPLQGEVGREMSDWECLSDFLPPDHDIKLVLGSDVSAPDVREQCTISACGDGCQEHFDTTADYADDLHSPDAAPA